MLGVLTTCRDGLPEGLGPMGVLTTCKIRISDAASNAFGWLQRNFSGLFDAMADALEVLIDAILALLQQPPNTGWLYDLRRSEIDYLYPPAWHPFLMTAIFVALAWWLHRGWRMPVLDRGRPSVHHQPGLLVGDDRKP